MTLWKKRTSKEKNKEKPRFKQGPYLLSPIGETDKYLAFGLEWSVVLGDKESLLAYQLARENSADYYTQGGGHMVGLLKLNRQYGDVKRGSELYSIASLFAQTLSSGAVIVRFQTPQGIWFMAAHNGVVQADSDCFVSTAEEVESRIAKFKTRFEDMQVYGDQEGDLAVPSIERAINQLGSAQRLKRASLNLKAVPRWGWLALGVVVIYGTANYALDEFNKHNRRKQQALIEMAKANPVAEWKKNIDRWASSTPVLGYTGLNQWLSAIETIPSFVGRWEMEGFRCNGKGQCSGSFHRMPLGSLASFEQYKPSTWHYQTKGIDTLTVTFSLPIELPTLYEIGLEHLPSAVQMKKEELNLFQRIAPMVSKVHINEVNAVSIPPPRQQNGAIPFPKNSNLTLPFISTFSATLPLRNFLLLDWGPYYALDSIEVYHSANATAPSKVGGWLQVDVQGSFYVADKKE